jgi:uncharacterized protein (TIGR02145 family)
MKKQITILLIFTFFVYNSCNKEKSSTKESISPTFSISSTELLPMQMVTITASQGIADSNLKVIVNNETLVLIKASPTEFNFLCPILTPGTYKMIFENKFELTFSVKNYENMIQNPETNFSLFKTEIGQITADIRNSNLSNKTEISNELIYYRDAFDEITAKLNTQEKLKLAYLIHSNGLDKSGFSDELNINIPDSFLGKWSIFDPTDASNIFAIKYTSAKLNVLIFGSAALALYAAPSPDPYTKGAAVIAALVAASNFAIMHKLIDKDLPYLLVKATGIDALQKKANTITFYNNNATDIDYTGTFTNIIASDKEKNIMPSLFSGITEMNTKLSQLYDAYNKIKSWFITSQPTKNKKLFVVGNTVRQKQFYLNPTFLSVKSVSNPQIQLQLINNGGVQQLLAKSSTISTETNFTFTLTYKQEKINNIFDQTFSAVLKPEVFLLFDAKNKLVLDVINFVSETPQNFSVTSDIKKPSSSADYTKIEVKNNSNSKVLVEVIPYSNYFALKLTNNGSGNQTASFDLFYKGVSLQRLTTIVADANTFIDPRDGQIYKIVKIGNQWWFAQNLNYQTGNSWCYNNNPANCTTYGRLYDWETAKIACPPGWHLPSDAEWSQLIEYLGGAYIAGGKMKSTTVWNTPNTNATNSSGFSGLPGGVLDFDMKFKYIGGNGYWWSSTKDNTGTGNGFSLFYDRGGFYDVNGIINGESVRCVRD